MHETEVLDRVDRVDMDMVDSDEVYQLFPWF